MRPRFSFSKILYVLFFFVNFIGGQAQIRAQMPIHEAELDAYNQAVQMVKITHNKGDLLPIRHLAQAKIAFFSPSGASSMLTTLQKYTDIQQVDMNSIGSAAFNTLIVYIDQSTPESINAFTPFLAKAKTILFTKDSVDFPKGFDAIITSDELSPLTQSIAAQYIMGGITNSEETFRLGYAPPIAVGMDKDILEDSIQSIVNYGIAQGAYPGAQVLVAKNGKIIYHKTFGSPTYENKRPISTEDIYDMASVSKVTTALPALMVLNGQGKFNLDDPMKKLWPDFKHTSKADLTWRSVLAHNARLQPWIAYWTNTVRKKPKRNGWRYKSRTFKPKMSKRYPIHVTDELWLHKKYRKRMFKAIKKTPLNKEPGYKYSGLAFYLFPSIVENITGDEFEHFLKSNIYQPIGANTLTFNPLRFFPKDRIIPTEQDTFFRMQQLHGTVHDEGAAMMKGVSSNAGLFGTANDMAKLWQMYLNKGDYGGEQIIQPKVIEEFSKCQYCDEGNYRGLGFDKPKIEYDSLKAGYAKDASPTTFGHSGYTGTLVWADPEHQILFIFLSNRVYKTRLNRKLYTLDIRPRIHNAIYSARK